jgi:hypothetical protein
MRGGKNMVKDEVKEKVKEESIWNVGFIATKTETVIVNKNNPEEQLDIFQALVKILNSLEELKKLL